MMKPAYLYDIHVPSNIDSERTYPAIFTLHGKGSDERDMFGLVSPLAEQFIVINIRGDLTAGAGYQYYELKGIGQPIREMFDRAVQQLEAFIQYASEKYPIDTSRRYLLGFSQGAILSMSLALTMGNQLRGIVALNGYVPEFVKTEYNLQSIQDVSVFISHGQMDPVFPIRIGQETSEYMQSLSSNVTFKTYPTGHGVSRDNQQDFLNWIQEDASMSHNKE